VDNDFLSVNERCAKENVNLCS